jgi:hypothetical protein
MTADDATIEELRQQFTQSFSKGFGTQMHAFMELCAHPDLEWNDLLDAVGRPGVIPENAVLLLHQRLKVRVDKNDIHMDRSFWEAILKEKGIKPADKCGAFPLARGPGWTATT